MMQQLGFPDYTFTLKQDKGKTFILDPVRKKYVKLTPEEWVRQHIIKYLSESLNYPYSHMCIEKSLNVNKLSKRADILIYNEELAPALLVECKAPDITLTNRVFEQVSAYNIAFKVPWLLITNGITHYASHINYSTGKISHIDYIPEYNQLMSPFSGTT